MSYDAPSRIKYQKPGFSGNSKSSRVTPTTSRGKPSALTLLPMMSGSNPNRSLHVAYEMTRGPGFWPRSNARPSAMREPKTSKNWSVTPYRVVEYGLPSAPTMLTCWLQAIAAACTSGCCSFCTNDATSLGVMLPVGAPSAVIVRTT